MKEDETMEADKKVQTNEFIENTICPDEVCKKRADVTYGTIEYVTYMSKTTGLERGANVLLPAGYHENKKYPVLYFLHGIFEDEHRLIKEEKNKLIEISGNLMADDVARKWIIVFPNMYASSDPDQKPEFKEEAVEPYNNFINDLTNDLIPFIEDKYATYTDRAHRAIMGFSMGGRETLFIGITRPDLFQYMGAIAPAPGVVPAKDWAMEHKGQLTEDNFKFATDEFLPGVFMICCGTDDKVVGKFPTSYHELLLKNRVEHIWYEVPGADHDSNVIRSGFYNMLILMGTEK